MFRCRWSVESIRSDAQSLREKLTRIKELLEQTDPEFCQQLERFMEVSLWSIYHWIEFVDRVLSRIEPVGRDVA